MATIGTNFLTMADWALRHENERVAVIVELMSQYNAVLDDMITTEGNMTAGHKTTVRRGIPKGTWSRLYKGIPLTKSRTAQIVDTAGTLEAESQVDRRLVRLNNNSSEFRLSESVAHIQGMSQQIGSHIFYGSEASDPESFTGLAPRYSSLSAENGGNIVNAGGVGTDNTSMWVVTWGPQTCHCFFPKGTTAGLQHEDKGEWRVTDSNGDPYWALVDHYEWSLGLTLRDWRYVVRIPNIDVSALSSASPANLSNLLINACAKIPTSGGMASKVTESDARGIQGAMGNTVIYCNRTVQTALEVQAENKPRAFLTYEEAGGKVVPHFRGIPIKICDGIINNEAAVA